MLGISLCEYKFVGLVMTTPPLHVGVDIPHLVFTAHDPLARQFLRVKHLLFTAPLPLDIVPNLLNLGFGLFERQLMKFFFQYFGTGEVNP
jgi:hypothetical protein